MGKINKCTLNVKQGDLVGNFIYIKSELIGKNKTHIGKCRCGNEIRFWKFSVMQNQKSCGCGLDNVGFTKEQRRTFNSRLNSYKNGAKNRNLDWELSYEDFFNLTQANCTFCGLKPKKINYFANAPSLKKESPNRNWDKYTINFNGVDRLDNSKGYTLENSVSCCIYCNRAKSDLSLDEFKERIKKIYNYLNL